jgi:hypothetical protein
VLGYDARAKGLAFLGVVVQAASLINTFALPIALEKITWKGTTASFLFEISKFAHAPTVYIIFTVWDAFEVLVIYFFVVETKGFTLEEIGEIFSQPNPRQYSDQLLKNARAKQVGESATPA